MSAYWHFYNKLWLSRWSTKCHNILTSLARHAGVRTVPAAAWVAPGPGSAPGWYVPAHGSSPHYTVWVWRSLRLSLVAHCAALDTDAPANGYQTSHMYTQMKQSTLELSSKTIKAQEHLRNSLKSWCITWPSGFT